MGKACACLWLGLLLAPPVAAGDRAEPAPAAIDALIISPSQTCASDALESALAQLGLQAEVVRTGADPASIEEAVRSRRAESVAALVVVVTSQRQDDAVRYRLCFLEAGDRQCLPVLAPDCETGATSAALLINRRRTGLALSREPVPEIRIEPPPAPAEERPPEPSVAPTDAPRSVPAHGDSDSLDVLLGLAAFYDLGLGSRSTDRADLCVSAWVQPASWLGVQASLGGGWLLVPPRFGPTLEGFAFSAGLGAGPVFRAGSLSVSPQLALSLSHYSLKSPRLESGYQHAWLFELAAGLRLQLDLAARPFIEIAFRISPSEVVVSSGAFDRLAVLGAGTLVLGAGVLFDFF